MDSREHKTNELQPLLQEYKVDINNQQQPSDTKTLRNVYKSNHQQSANISIEKLDDLIKRIDAAISILKEIKLEPTVEFEGTNRLATKYRRFCRYINYIGFVVFPLLLMIFCDSRVASTRTEEGHRAALIIRNLTIFLFVMFELYACYKMRTYSFSKGLQSFAATTNRIQEDEKQSILELAGELEINPHENTLDNLVKLLEDKKSFFNYQKNNGPCKIAFMMGGDSVYGAKSSVRTLFNNALFDKKVCGLVFQFADFSDIPKKEKADRVMTELKNIMFFTQPFDQEKDDGIIQEILTYMGLNDAELNAEHNAVMRLA